jgi:hypothetical protein
MIEDKEYPVHVTDDMIMQYKNMVYKTYYKYFHPKFLYLQADLIQCGFWGVFLAHQRYERKFSHYAKPVFFALTIHNKMCQYIDHEKHHILQDLDEEYDFSQHSDFDEENGTFWADFDKIYARLDNKNQVVLRKWLLGDEFGQMGFGTRQAAHYRFNKIKRTIKEYYNEQ